MKKHVRIFWPYGKFTETFSQLNETTKFYQKLELHNVNKVLGAELQRSGERIEFLGLKFPERVIATWGVVFVVIIQLYFWLHLRALRRRLSPNDPGLNVPWIGLYSHAWARGVSLVSVSMLPFGAVLYLMAWRGWFSWASALLIPGLILAYSSARSVLSLPRKNLTIET